MLRFKPLPAHRSDVSRVQKNILENKNASFSLSKSTLFSNTLRNGEYKKSVVPLDFSHLNQPLALDLKNRWITVEPRMTVRALAELTLKYGLVPAVVPEFGGITVGGAIFGAALESSSHQYGQFNDTCLEYELLLGDGTLVRASPEENSDLFYGLSGSYGSLALLTSVKINLIPAKPYVTINYQRFHEKRDLLSFFTQAQKADFLDGVVISNEWQVGMSGSFSSYQGSLPLFRQKRTWDSWFFPHLARITQKGNFEEVMPIRDYLFRFDRSAFWMGRFLTRLSLILRVQLKRNLENIKEAMKVQIDAQDPAQNPPFWFRALLGWAFSSQQLYRLWHSVPKNISERIFFIQDFYIPIEKALDALNHIQEKTAITPIWLCPIKGTQTPQILSPHYGSSLFVNLGFYGIPTSHLPIPELTAEVEKDILNFGGRKMLYSLTYYSPEIFSKIYDYEQYSELRKKFHADPTFLPLYKKISSML